MTTARPGRLRVVLDTNVYFSAFTHPQGGPFRIWQRAISLDFTLLVSPAIMREVAGTLRTKANLAEDAVIADLKLLARVAEIVMPRITLRVVVADPDDDRILECAVAGSADLIVSGDRHLTKLKAFQGIGIVSPANFLHTLPK